MSRETLHKYKDDFFVLLEAGFMAVNQQDEDSAIKLFRASEVLNPESTFPKIGFGYMHMCKLELKQASKIFEEVSKKEPENEMAKTFLGICMSMSPGATNKGEKILEQSASKSDDPDIRNLASSAMDFVDNFVKKAPSPMEVNKNKKGAAKKAAAKKPRKK